MLDTFIKSYYLLGIILYALLVDIPFRRRSRGKTIASDENTPLHIPLMALAYVGGRLLPLIYVFTSWLDFAEYRLPQWARWGGAILFAGALLLLRRARTDLGRSWSATLQVVDEHALVTQGIYRHIRHPMYAALWLWSIAQLLMFANWIAGPSMLISFLPLYLYRVPREEQMMLARFGPAYTAYMAQTGRVIPRLWR